VTAAVNDGTADLRRSTKLRLRLFSPLDWPSWASLAAVLAAAAALAALPAWRFYQFKQEERRLERQREEQERRQAAERAELERQRAEVRVKLEAQRDSQQEGFLRRILGERSERALSMTPGEKEPTPAPPGSLLKMDGDILAICCVVVTDRSKRCFLTSNTSFVLRGDWTGERVYLLSADGKKRGPAVGVVEKVSPLTFTGENTGGALVRTDRLLVTAKLPPALAIRGAARPAAGQSVRMLVGTKVFPGVVAEGERPEGMEIKMVEGQSTRFKGAFVIRLAARTDLRSVRGGAPVITDSNDLVGMTYALDERKPQEPRVVAISIAALFEDLGVKELVKD
jgi:hypothetical protein